MIYKEEKKRKESKRLMTENHYTENKKGMSGNNTLELKPFI